MAEDKKDKIVFIIVHLMASIGVILVIVPLLFFAFNTGLMFGLFILGALLVAVSLAIDEIYREDI